MSRLVGSRTLLACALGVLATLAAGGPAGAAPEGQMTWAVHTTLVPTWFDPAETIQGTPFMVLSATHDALVKPMPGKSMAPALAESWSTSADGLVYDFVLRKGVRFHTGEPVTAEDGGAKRSAEIHVPASCDVPADHTPTGAASAATSATTRTASTPARFRTVSSCRGSAATSTPARTPTSSDITSAHA